MYGYKIAFFVFTSSWVCNEEISKDNVSSMPLVNLSSELTNLCKIIFFFLKFERTINYIENQMHLLALTYKITTVVDLHF